MKLNLCRCGSGLERVARCDVADPAHRFPFGWVTRLVTEGSDGQSRQRPFG